MNLYADPEKLKELKAAANALPLDPGVYIMKNSSGQIIYVGKAKALKNRVTQYFGSGNQHTEKVRRMVSNVDRFDYIVCGSEFEALILENSLIKQNQPKYNILLKDDKGYFYIKITAEKWKRIEAANTVEKDGTYLGPYNSGYIVKQTVDEAKRIFRLPDCTRNFDTPSKPCLNYHIGLCEAPCRGKTSLENYLESVNSAVEFIKGGGENEKTAAMLTEKMERAAEQLDFEYAARLRDRIKALHKIREKQKVVMSTYKSQDVIASALAGEMACVAVLIFRGSRLCDKQYYFIDGVKDRASLYSEFLQRYYENKSDIPPRILIDAQPEDTDLLERWLTESAARIVRLIEPKVGEQKQLLTMCADNAAESLSMRTQRTGREMTALNELAELLKLPLPPRSIEAYDISNTAGTENVAAMVVFRDARPCRQDYRKFKIKSFSGQDDFRSMAEVMERRLCELEDGKDAGFAQIPDLILLDGGEGQLSAVLPVLQRHGVSIPIFGMVKDSKHKTRAITAGGGDIAIKSTRRAYTLITAIQDEVHRFAISYHRQRRSSSMLQSELRSIPSVGEKRAAALLKHFKTMDKIRSADEKELCGVPGISAACASEIRRYFAESRE